MRCTYRPVAHKTPISHIRIQLPTHAVGAKSTAYQIYNTYYFVYYSNMRELYEYAVFFSFFHSLISAAALCLCYFCLYYVISITELYARMIRVSGWMDGCRVVMQKEQYSERKICDVYYIYLLINCSLVCFKLCLVNVVFASHRCIILLHFFPNHLQFQQN